MSNNKVFNRNISPISTEALQRGFGPTERVESDYRSLFDEPQMTIHGHLVPPLLSDFTPPTIQTIFPLPGTFPFNIDTSLIYFDLTFNEPLVNYELLDNWVLSGLAAQNLSVSAVTPLGSNGLSYTYRLDISGTLLEGLLQITINPTGAASPIRDTEGNLFPEFTWDYYVDLTRPRIEQVQPIPGTQILFDGSFSTINMQVTFSEFMGVEGQDWASNPASNTNFYTLQWEDAQGEVLYTENAYAVTKVSETAYSYGPDAGSLVVDLFFTGPSESVRQQTAKLILRVEDKGLSDRAGNDLLADVLEYHWPTAQPDTEGPTWNILDPSPECYVVQRPVFNESSNIADGLRFMEFQFSEPVSWNPGVMQPENWVISGVPSTTDSGQAYTVSSVSDLGDNKYGISISTVADTDGYEVTVGLVGGTVTDLAGNPFIGGTFTYSLESTFPTISTVSPISPDLDWDGVLDVRFSHNVRRMTAEAMRNAWNLENPNLSTPVGIAPVDVTEIVDSSFNIIGHQLTFSSADLMALQDPAQSVNLLFLNPIMDFGYETVDGQSYPRAVRSFPSNSEVTPMGSCGGSGVPLSDVSYGWSQPGSTIINWLLDTTGPVLVSTDKQEATVHSLESLTEGVTFTFNESIDWAQAQYSITGSIVGPIPFASANVSDTATTVQADLDGVSLHDGEQITFGVQNIRDLVGNSGADASVTLYVADITAPAVTTVTGTLQDLCYPNTVTYFVHFSEDVVNIDNASNYAFRDAQGTEALITIQAAVANSARQAQLTLIGPSDNAYADQTLYLEIVNKAGNPIQDTSGNQAVLGTTPFPFHIGPCHTESLYPPENVSAGEPYQESGTWFTLVNWDAPSQGLTPESYSIKIGSSTVWTGDVTGPVAVSLTGFPAGTYDLSVSTHITSTGESAESGPVTLVVPQDALVTPTGYLTSDDAVIEVQDFSLKYGPSHLGYDWDGDIRLMADLAAEVERVGVYVTSSALMAGAGSGFLEQYRELLPSGFSGSLPTAEESSWPLSLAMGDFPSEADLTGNYYWIHLGTWETPHMGESSWSFIVTNQKLWDAIGFWAADTNVTQWGDANATRDSSKWWRQILPFQDAVLFALVPQVGGVNQEAVLYGSDVNTPVLTLPPPHADHPDYGYGAAERHPVLTLDQDADTFTVSWIAPMRGHKPPYSYQAHLFERLDSQSSPAILETVNSGGLYNNAVTFNTTPKEGAQYFARITAKSDAGLSWDAPDPGEVQMNAYEGFASRSNVITFNQVAGITLERSEPANGSIITNAEGLSGVLIELLYTGSFSSYAQGSHDLHAIDSNGNELLLGIGSDYTVIHSENPGGKSTLKFNMLKDYGQIETGLRITPTTLFVDNEGSRIEHETLNYTVRRG